MLCFNISKKMRAIEDTDATATAVSAISSAIKFPFVVELSLPFEPRKKNKQTNENLF